MTASEILVGDIRQARATLVALRDHSLGIGAMESAVLLSHVIQLLYRLIEESDREFEKEMEGK
ncbi:hypothetical protein LCGC14_1326140 [marine sediment metagenome]|uniref:Uncharacterized protein n=1 Tax=marine sediment metagenome TaxID=412755 RepID=A0A0F9KIN3_9ZZZZ